MRRRSPAARGTMEVGVPLVTVAILGSIVLSNFWDRLGGALRVVFAVLLGLVALAGFLMLGKPGGLGANVDPREFQDKDDDEP